jgi:hypothetical protein
MKNQGIATSLMVIFCMAFSSNIFAQTNAIEKDVTKNKTQTAVYFEILGTGGLYSINAEERWQVNSSSQFGVRVGFTKYNSFFASVHKTSVPVLLSYSLSMGPSNQNFIEFGAGANFSDLRGRYSDYSTGGLLSPGDDYVNGLYVIPTGSLAYRYQGHKGLMLKAAITPSLQHSGLVGLSFGYAF